MRWMNCLLMSGIKIIVFALLIPMNQSRICSGYFSRAKNENKSEKSNRTIGSIRGKTIYTDGLGMYQKLIPESNHKIHRRCTNHIERQNLTLRTHLKRLNRRTICYSKSITMLYVVVKIYFWGGISHKK